MAGKKNDVIRCLFCGKTVDQVGGKLISGPNNAYICYSCVDLCAEIVDEEEFGDGGEVSIAKEEINLLKPEELKAFTENVMTKQGRLTANNYVPLSEEEVYEIYQQLY